MALMQATVWFPLLLWLADRAMESTDRKRTALMIGWSGLLFGMLILVGSAQIVFYEGFLLFFYLIGYVFQAREGRGWRFGRAVGMTAWMALIGGLIGAVILLPAREFASLTVRESIEPGFYRLGTWLTPSRLAAAFYFPAYGRPAEVTNWASSLIYVGLMPSMLALMRLLGIRVNWRKDAPLIVMGGVALFLAFGWNNPVNHLLVKIPPFSMLRYQGRFAIGAIVGLIGLACTGMSEYWSRTEEGGLNKRQIVWILSIILVSLFFFILNAARSKAILWGAIVLIVDIGLTWWAVVSLGKRTMSSRLPLWAAVYVVFHLLIVFPVGRIITMPETEFHQALQFFDQLHRSDGLPPRLLAIDIGTIEDRDLLAFNKFTPQDNLPNLCAGNTSIFKNVQTMDPYTPLRPKEWADIIRDKIDRAFKNVDQSGILDANTSGLLEQIGVDYVVTSGRTTRIPGFARMNVDLADAFGPNARMFVAEREHPRLLLTAEGDMLRMRRGNCI